MEGGQGDEGGKVVRGGRDVGTGQGLTVRRFVQRKKIGRKKDDARKVSRLRGQNTRILRNMVGSQGVEGCKGVRKLV
jgi:hypothetical protein